MRIAPTITLTAAERAKLERLTRARSAPLRLQERAAIVLLAASGLGMGGAKSPSGDLGRLPAVVELTPARRGLGQPPHQAGSFSLARARRARRLPGWGAGWAAPWTNLFGSYSMPFFQMTQSVSRILRWVISRARILLPPGLDLRSEICSIDKLVIETIFFQ